LSAHGCRGGLRRHDSFISFRVVGTRLIQKVWGCRGREGLGGVERGIGDVVDFARVPQVFGQLRDVRQQRLLIGFVPGEGLQEEWDAVLIGRHPEDKLLEIPPAVLGWL